MSLHENYLRSIVFGFQDALVSTTGVIAGVATGTQDKQIVVLAGLATIAVEALSMGAGQYMSDKTVQQYKKDREHTDSPAVSGMFMFGSYFLGGLIPLSQILLFRLPEAAIMSVIFALVGLFILGLIKAKIVKVSPLHSAFEALLLGGAASAVGIVVGYLFSV